MNILIICHYGLYKDLTSSFVHNQLRELTALGNRVRIIVPNGLGKVGPDGKKVGKLLSKREADSVEIFDLRHITLSSYGKKGLNAFFAKLSLGLCINKISQDFTPDVIHAHTLGFDSNLGKRLSKRFSCPPGRHHPRKRHRSPACPRTRFMAEKAGGQGRPYSLGQQQAFKKACFLPNKYQDRDRSQRLRPPQTPHVRKKRSLVHHSGRSPY